MKILVSGCLLGLKCKYDGGDNRCEKVVRLMEEHEVIPVCPECLGRLPVPRVPSEIVDGVVTNAEGVVVDRQFREGAREALEVAREKRVDLAVLQPRSPSCGVRAVYDGSFTGTLRPGSGVFAALLIENGFKVIEPDDL